MRVFLALARIVIRPTLDTVQIPQLASLSHTIQTPWLTVKTYTCTFRTSTLADGDCGKKRTERAIRPATLKATVVKKLKTFCTRTREECILEITPWEVMMLLL